MQTVLSHEGAHGRDMCGMFKDRCWGKNLGLAMSEGEFWEKTKTWTFKTLKTLGFGKSAEVERYVQVSPANNKKVSIILEFLYLCKFM